MVKQWIKMTDELGFFFSMCDLVLTSPASSFVLTSSTQCVSTFIKLF